MYGYIYFFLKELPFQNGVALSKWHCLDWENLLRPPVGPVKESHLPEGLFFCAIFEFWVEA